MIDRAEFEKWAKENGKIIIDPQDKFMNTMKIIELIKEKNIKYIDALAIMFMKPKKLFTTTALFALFMAMGIFRKEFLVILAIAIISAMFVKINKSTIETLDIKR